MQTAEGTERGTQGFKETERDMQKGDGYEERASTIMVTQVDDEIYYLK